MNKPLRFVFTALGLAPQAGLPYRAKDPLNLCLNAPTGLGRLMMGVGFMLAALLAQAQTYPTNGITVAGNGSNGSAANQLFRPVGVALDGAGAVYIVDQGNHRVQKWAVGASSGVTVAGGNGDGAAANQFNYPQGVAVDGTGAIYVSDWYNNRIQKFPPNSTSATLGTTVAGNGSYGSGANQLYMPSGIFLDNAGALYVSDEFNYRVQKFPPNSTSASSATTVAGGDYGGGVNQMRSPSGVYVDGAGVVYVTDNANHRVQKWTSGGSVIVAGGNGQGSDPNQLDQPNGVFVDGAGVVYVADTGNSRIQKWAPGATSGTTVVGQLYGPRGMIRDGSGAIYVVESGYSRVQKFSVCQTITAQPAAGPALCPGSPVSFSVGTAGGVTAFQWFKDGNALTSPASATTASLSLSAVSPASAGSYRVQVNGVCSNLTSTPFSLSVLAAPSGLASSSSSTVLVGGTVSLSASGGTSYQWAAPAGTALIYPLTNPVVSAIFPVSGLQTFTVVITNQAGCSQRLPVSVTALVVADLTPTLFARPSILYGSSAMSVVVNLAEINNQATSGVVTLKITKDAKVSLTFPGSASTVGGRTVQNSGWSFDNTTPGYYTLTSLAPIPAGGGLSVGLEGLLNPGATMGDLSISATVSGGDAGGINNADADKIQYFPQ